MLLKHIIINNISLNKNTFKYKKTGGFLNIKFEYEVNFSLNVESYKSRRDFKSLAAYLMYKRRCKKWRNSEFSATIEVEADFSMFCKDRVEQLTEEEIEIYTQKRQTLFNTLELKLKMIDYFIYSDLTHTDIANYNKHCYANLRYADYALELEKVFKKKEYYTQAILQDYVTEIANSRAILIDLAGTTCVYKNVKVVM